MNIHEQITEIIDRVTSPEYIAEMFLAMDCENQAIVFNTMAKIIENAQESEWPNKKESFRYQMTEMLPYLNSVGKEICRIIGEV